MSWMNQDISILFKDLKFVETLLPMSGYMGIWVGGCFDGWVNGWVNAWGQVKSLKIE